MPEAAAAEANRDAENDAAAPPVEVDDDDADD
jgi:hypothetical protein